MPTTRRLWVSVVTRASVSLAILVAAVIVYQLLYATRPRPEVVEGNTALTRVRVFEVRSTEINRQWRGFGTAVAMDAADVPAEITAVVASRPEGLRPGVVIKKGQLLLELDVDDLKRRLTAAQANLTDIEARLSQLASEQGFLERRVKLENEEVAIAQSELDRVQKLRDTNSINPRDLEQTKKLLIAAERSQLATEQMADTVRENRKSLNAQLEAQKQAVGQAQRDVERTSITSPIDGVLASFDVDLGEQVTAGRRVARVVNLQRIETPIRLPASARLEVKLGDAVTLLSTGQIECEWHANIARLSPVDDESSRTFTVYVELRQPSDPAAIRLAPGQFVEGIITTGGVSGSSGGGSEMMTVVPRSAIEADRIWLVEGGKVQSQRAHVAFALERAIPETGLDVTEWSVLENALPIGTLVIIDPPRALAEGQMVEPVLPHQTTTPPVSPTVTPASPASTPLSPASTPLGAADPQREDQP